MKIDIHKTREENTERNAEEGPLFCYTLYICYEYIPIRATLLIIYLYFLYMNTLAVTRVTA